ncbi:hypothetical protein EV360DRAFT_83028 [Lentinula raphanica]|nr:hypothetical protein EV360DRAFT_83028 [Lentinula raphanica]
MRFGGTSLASTIFILLLRVVNTDALQHSSTQAGSSANQSIGIQFSVGNETFPELPGHPLTRRSAISVSFRKGQKLSAKEISTKQEQVRDSVQKFLISAQSQLHTAGWIINWENNPSPSVKPGKDKIMFDFTGPAACTNSKAPSTAPMVIDRRRDGESSDAAGNLKRENRARLLRTRTRAVSENVNDGCSGFVLGNAGELRDNRNEVIYPVKN